MEITNAREVQEHVAELMGKSDITEDEIQQHITVEAELSPEGPTLTFKWDGEPIVTYVGVAVSRGFELVNPVIPVAEEGE